MAMAEHIGCAMILTGYINKAQGLKSGYRGLGSIDFLAAALRHRVVVIDGLKEFTHELKGIGRNVSQLVVLANMGKIQEVQLGETLEALGRIYHQLRELAEQEHR